MTKILGVDISPNDKSLTFSKMSDIATGNLIGRSTEGTGAMETLNASTVRTLLDVPVTSHTHPSILTTSISDGDITHAPDGNSVFDALALKIDLTQKGATNGVASLDENKLVPTTQLPSYVDDVLEFATLSVFPVTGETGKIYVDLATNKTYRWSGSTYIYITSGAVDSVAGKTGVVSLVKADVGLSNVDNTADASKPVATTSVNGIMSSTDKTKLDAITGTNTGDETNSSIKTKLGITTLSGSNTGDQNLQSVIAASITDGDTTHAPDGNSVFDALDLKANLASPTFTGTVAGITKAMVGLSNVDNTADASKPVATTSVNGIMSSTDKTKLDAITGTNTGDQTSVTGNAGTATKLQTARTINGISFDGSQNITINAVDSTARIASSEKGAVSGVATLDVNGLILTTQLPSYVDDVLEYNTLSVFPATGTTGKIYVDLATNKTYRWSGSAYIYITSGAVDSVAGKTGVVTLAKADVGLGSVDNTADVNKPVATTSVNGIMSSTDKTKLDAITGTNTGDQINITGNAATATNATNHIADVTGGVHGATNANTANMIVRRDASGGFSAGAIAATTITATSDITAYYSDERLKDFHGTISSALDKILSLNGYYFTENEIAKSLGCNNNKVQVGLSAQEVERVLPEVVTLSPIKNDQEYKTIWYDKLIPLLVEAIKEQQVQIDDLKKRLL